MATSGQASTSASAKAASTSSLHHHSGLRSQLAHLRHRHAIFQVKLDIHQISSVPYVYGEFGVKWRFKNVVSTGPNAGLLSKIRGHRTTSGQSSVKGKERATEGPEIVVHDHDEEDGEVGSGEEEESSLREWERSKVNNSSVSLNLLKPEPPSPKSPSPLSSSSDSQSSLGSHTIYSDARGMTGYAPLREHSVKWGHAVAVAVQMDVQRDTLALLPNELKLVVKQRVIPGDPDSPENPRLGHVLLNLAEYAGAGPVTRNYLLRQSKTNAVLKLTIDVTHIGGAKDFKPPPLRKGEILAGVAGLLHNEVYRAPAWLDRTLDLYGEYSDAGGVRSRSIDSNATVTDRSVNGDVSRKRVPFELDQLPSAYGPRTTETLIEAIFNPVPTSSTASSPFTYYVPPGAEESGQGEQGGSGASSSSSSGSVDSEEKRSVMSGTDSASGVSPSLASGESEAGSASGKQRGWWSRHKIGGGGGGGRPGTPNFLRRERERPGSARGES